MEITTQLAGDLTEVLAVGRLDGYWADHLTRTLDELMRGGADRVCLRMERIDYVSSLGIRVLVSAYKKFKAVNGSFVIAGPTGNVLQVLELAGIVSLLTNAPAPAQPQARQAADPGAPRELSRGAARYEIHALPGRGMSCSAFGRPLGSDAQAYQAADSRRLSVAADAVSVGLGAFGGSFEECGGRFGEFLAIQGAAACLPADGSNSCDSLLSQGNYVPDMQVLYGLTCQGEFTQLARFEPQADGKGISLTELADAALELAGAPAACIVIAAESAGLIGASLRRSPASASSGTDPFAFPDVRTWLSFTTEPTHTRMLAVAAGVIARAPDAGGRLTPYLRPLGKTDELLGHVHAAAFRFRPLQRGLMQVSDAVRPCFERDTPESVLHLLADDRESGVPLESRFLRGALWIAPLHTITGETP